jgi:MFS family permease
LRRSLRISAIEGVLAEVVGACATGGVLTAWSIYLGLGPVLLGLLGALPFAAQLLQVPAAVLARRAGSRRTALVAVGVSRQAILPLALLPFLPLSPLLKEAVLLLCAGVSVILGVIANTAWTSWMGDLVPRAVRGRYFRRRNFLCALSSVAGSIAAGIALDGGVNAAGAATVLAALTLTASTAGLVTTLLLRLQQEPPRSAEPRAPALKEGVLPLRNAVARRALASQLAWGASSGLALAFYPLHFVGDLRSGFARMAAFGSGLAALRTFAAPAWEQILKKLGAGSVLVACAVGLSLSPALWFFAKDGVLWLLAVDAALCGVLTAGYSLTASSLPIADSGPRERAYFLAAFASAGGLATGLAATLGAALAHVLATRAGLLVATQLLFVLGALGRITAAVLGLRIVRTDAGATT